jgi:AraC family transcriptional regulator, transcriptional activator of the genes for pyochelin and ferripyochelin receptors
MSITLIPLPEPAQLEPLAATAPPDEFEEVWIYPEETGAGYTQDLQLQNGLELSIAQYRLHCDDIKTFPEHPHPIQAGFCLAGQLKYRDYLTVTGQRWLCGSGLALGGTSAEYARQPLMMINIHIDPERFRSSVSNAAGEVLPALAHLFRSSEQVQYLRYSQIMPAMEMPLRQILQCPYRGLTKRLYLESKALELLALSMEQELEPSTEERLLSSRTLKPEDRERIDAAREILQQRLDNPPTLLELARLVGLNDCTLKRGFRQVVGTTVFGYLYNCRMERARQMLREQRFNITEVAQQVGYANHRSFAVAFRRRYGVSPKQWGAG